MTMHRHRSYRRLRTRQLPQRGLSLLETILAIAILGGAIALVGESVRIGTIAAADARETTMAQLLCEAKLAELTSGLQQLTPTSMTPLEVAPDWLYTVQVEKSNQQGLIMVGVMVSRDPLQTARPVSVTLYRWIIDPELTAQLEAAAEAAAQAEAAANSSSSSSSTGGTSSGTGGTGNGR